MEGFPITITRALYAAIAACVVLVLLGGRIGAPASDATTDGSSAAPGSPPAAGLSARDMTLTVADLPDGAVLSEEAPLREKPAKDGYLRIFSMCECRLGDSVPLAFTSQVIVPQKEPYAKLLLKAMEAGSGREEFAEGFAEGAGRTVSGATTQLLTAPDVGDQSVVFRMDFTWEGIGAGIGYVGVVRIREVVSVVVILGLDGDIHQRDLHPLMERAAARIRGEDPPPATPTNGPAPAPVGQSA